MRKIAMAKLSAFFIVAGLSSTQANANEINVKDTQKIRDILTVDKIREHQQSLQRIADENGGTRVAGSSGYRASTDYVRERLTKAGYAVTLQEFVFKESADNSPPALIKADTEQKTYEANVDFASMSAVGYAEVEAEIEAVDLVVPSPSPNHSTSGCEREDFKNFTRGNIALIQRGTCTFQIKAENALAAGAVGVIIFNEGNSNRTGLISSRLKPTMGNFPVVGASFHVGDVLRNNQLHGPTGTGAFIRIDVLVSEHEVHNVIAETSAGDDSRVVVVGAHLDSVSEGAGINDNGSGSATNLQIAETFAQLRLNPRNKVRFIWFAAEEFGLLGSEFYVNSLTDREQRKILAMLNFDMLGSSNYARFVYDGDNSSQTEWGAQSGPEGSAYLEKVFLRYFSFLNMPSHPTAFNGRSDYGPFIEVGIPAGGLFSGAEGIKSSELARVYGGLANEPFDPCYHQSCDDFLHTGGDDSSVLALKSLDELSDAAAHAVFVLASTDDNIRPPQQHGPIPMPDFEYRGNLLIK